MPEPDDVGAGLHAVIPVLIAVGGLLAVQAAANVQLASALASPLGASTLQLGIGAVLLVALSAVAGSLGAFGAVDEATAWHLLGGLGSAVYITAGILLLPRPGALVTVGLALVLAVILAAGRAPRPDPAGLARVPWWGWLGGLCGAVYVSAVFVAIPEIGAAPTVALTVGGLQLATVLVDRHGLLRLPRRPVGPRRLLGVGLLLVGVVLIQAG